MKPKQSWKFSSRVADIDLTRIAREARPVNLDAVILVTIGDKAYTLCSRALFDLRVSQELIDKSYSLGALTRDSKVVEAFAPGCVFIAGTDETKAPAWYPQELDALVLVGDHVKVLTGRRETRVEVY